MKGLGIYVREEVERRADGRCECRGQCGKHGRQRCATRFGQARLLEGGTDSPVFGKRVVGRPSKASHVAMICEACSKTYQGIPASSREKDARSDYAHYTEAVKK